MLCDFINYNVVSAWLGDANVGESVLISIWLQDNA
jgi:hypothetical protein